MSSSSSSSKDDKKQQPSDYKQKDNKVGLGAIQLQPAVLRAIASVNGSLKVEMVPGIPGTFRVFVEVQSVTSTIVGSADPNLAALSLVTVFPHIIGAKTYIKNPDGATYSLITSNIVKVLNTTKELFDYSNNLNKKPAQVAEVTGRSLLKDRMSRVVLKNGVRIPVLSLLPANLVKVLIDVSTDDTKSDIDSIRKCFDTELKAVPPVAQGDALICLDTLFMSNKHYGTSTYVPRAGPRSAWEGDSEAKQA